MVAKTQLQNLPANMPKAARKSCPASKNKQIDKKKKKKQRQEFWEFRSLLDSFNELF